MSVNDTQRKRMNIEYILENILVHIMICAPMFTKWTIKTLKRFVYSLNSLLITAHGLQSELRTRNESLIPNCACWYSDLRCKYGLIAGWGGVFRKVDFSCAVSCMPLFQDLFNLNVIKIAVLNCEYAEGLGNVLVGTNNLAIYELYIHVKSIKGSFLTQRASYWLSNYEK